MDEFWAWMRNKARLSTHELSHVAKTSFVISANGIIYKGNNHEYIDLPKQVLIGYMIEYCIEKGCIISPSNEAVASRSIEKYHQELINHIEWLHRKIKKKEL